MERYGTGKSGRKSIAITFSSGKGKDGYKNVSAGVYKPKSQGKTGEKVKPKDMSISDVLVPRDVNERSWSPV
jgi:hypothetical protein